MKYKTATRADIPNVITHYKNVISSMNAEGFNIWDNNYPNEEIIINDIINNHMRILKDEGKIIAASVQNEIQDEKYNEIAWEYNEFPIIILHRLCVSPEITRQGVGSAMLAFLEKEALDNGFKSIRLDAFSKNMRAIKLYENAGYTKRGHTYFTKGKFYLYEKTFVL